MRPVDIPPLEALGLLFLLSCMVWFAWNIPDTASDRRTPTATQTPEPLGQIWLTSWYGENHQGKLMANGEPFDRKALTCAHRTLPFGTILKLRVGIRSVEVEVTDRGPYVLDGAGCYTRDLDVSEAAAERLGMVECGVAMVQVKEVGKV